MTPREVFFALNDFDTVHFLPARNISEVLRMVILFIRNKGLKRSAQIADPTLLFKFAWEKPEPVKIQTVEEMKHILTNVARKFNKRKR